MHPSASSWKGKVAFNCCTSECCHRSNCTSGLCRKAHINDDMPSKHLQMWSNQDCLIQSSGSKEGTSYDCPPHRCQASFDEAISFVCVTWKHAKALLSSGLKGCFSIAHCCTSLHHLLDFNSEQFFTLRYFLSKQETAQQRFFLGTGSDLIFDCQTRCLASTLHPI